MGALCNSPSQDSQSAAAVEAVGNDSHIDNKENNNNNNTDTTNNNNNNNKNNPTTTDNNSKPRSNSRARAVPPIPRVLIIQNDVICPPATAIASLVDHQIPYQVIYAFHEKAFLLLKPEMYEAIIVLGGRADVYSEAQYPWLIPEKAFLKEALYLDIPILGICLGCQLLAECSGGTVIAGKYGSEVGYKDWIFHSEMNETIMNNINSNLTNSIVNNNNNNNDENKDNNNNNNNNNNNSLGLTHLGSSEGSVNRKPSESNISTVVRAADDPFLYALKDKDLDKYVILFHGDTFTLANKLKTQSGDKKITLLASTDLYPTLFRVGKNSYGFQGHPELTPDLILVWTRGWGDEWLSKLTIDIENDVRKYAQNNHDNIIFSSLTLFDIWIDITLEDDCQDDNPKQFEEYTAQHWNRANDRTLQAYERSVLGTQANETPNNDNDNDNNDNVDESESGIPYPAGAHTRTNTNTRQSGVGAAALNLNLKLANNESERITGPTFKPPNVDNPMMHVPGASPLKAISQDDEIE